jgi:hypothetical protein
LVDVDTVSRNIGSRVDLVVEKTLNAFHQLREPIMCGDIINSSWNASY